MAYGKIKAGTLVYDNSGSDVEVTLASLGSKAPVASPTFTGTPAAPTAAANTNTTQIATTAYVQTELGDYLTTALGAPKASPTFTGTINGAALTLSGNLQVNGTTTTVASSTMTVTDKNIEIAKGAANNAAADGAGITVDSGDGDKTWNWVDATASWTSSEHIHLGDGKRLKVGTGSDLNLYHTSDINYIEVPNAATGDLKIETLGAKSIHLRAGDDATGAHNSIICKSNSSVELYHDNSKKFETTAAGVTVTGTVSDSKGDVRKIPLNNITSAYTAVAADSGKTIYTNSGVTINNSVFATGDAVTIVNSTGSDITITQGSGLNLYNSADASTGNRTLAGRGMATIYFAATNYAYISGAGLS